MLSAQEPDDSLRAAALQRLGRLEAVAAAEISQPLVELGRALFWDRRLSVNGEISCAICHAATDWGADRRQFSTDARGKLTSRNSPTVFNAVRLPMLRWTGDRKDGTEQAAKSLTGSMGFEHADDVVPLLERLGYEAAFRRAFPALPASDRVFSSARYAEAIAAYEATLVTPAPLDQYLAGDETALTPSQKTGLQLFLDTGCADCHEGTFLGGTKRTKLGVRHDYWAVRPPDGEDDAARDEGLFESTGAEEDRMVFRVPALRNVSRTGPWFHDGSVAGITDAIQRMAHTQLGVELAEPDLLALAGFLESLTGAVPEHYAPPEVDRGSPANDGPAVGDRH